jgi:hypothetical protein
MSFSGFFAPATMDTLEIGADTLLRARHLPVAMGVRFSSNRNPALKAIF